MDRKSHLLSNLKKQVITLKNQLERIVNHKTSKIASRTHQTSRHSNSISHSSRFDSTSLDSTYLQRGIKKFPLADSKFKNIAQIIKEKSQTIRTPKLSSQRRAQLQRTKENFNPDFIQTPRTTSRSPNPITGEGYSSKKEGKRHVFEQKSPKIDHPRERRHFTIYDHY